MTALLDRRNQSSIFLHCCVLLLITHREINQSLVPVHYYTSLRRPDSLIGSCHRFTLLQILALTLAFEVLGLAYYDGGRIDERHKGLYATTGRHWRAFMSQTCWITEFGSCKRHQYHRGARNAMCASNNPPYMTISYYHMVWWCVRNRTTTTLSSKAINFGMRGLRSHPCRLELISVHNVPLIRTATTDVQKN